MIYLKIPGKPFGKQRPKFARGRTYTPQATVDAEARVRSIAIQAGVKPIDGPIKLSCKFVYEPPKSWSKKKRLEAMGTWKTSKPDRDNLEKLVADALNGIAYADDSQVVTGPTQKFYGQEDATFIRVEPAPERVPMEAA